MAKPSNNPVHQHFVPKSYLKNFAEVRQRIPFVDTIMRGSEVIKLLPTKSICAEKNIYTFPEGGVGDRFALEKFYAKEVDGVYPRVYDVLTNPDYFTITKETKREILNTILSLYFRSPVYYNERVNRLKLIFGRMRTVADPEQVIHAGIRDGKRISFKRKDLEGEFKRQRDSIHEDWLISHFGEWQEFVDYKMNCGMDVITVPEDIPLITSDSPVLLFDMQGNLNENIFAHDNMIEVALNRSTYFIIHPNFTADPRYHRIHRSERDKQFAGVLNRQIQEKSHLRLISYPGDLEKHFDIQPSLDEWSPENMKSLQNVMDKTTAGLELMQVINKCGTLFHPDVARKVKEIRVSGHLNGEKLFENVILELAKKGFLTV